MVNVSFQRSKALITPMRLYWDMNKELQLAITNAYRFATKVTFSFSAKLYETVGVRNQRVYFNQGVLILF